MPKLSSSVFWNGAAPSATASAPAFKGDWPAGKKGYTVQLQTLPKTGTDPSAVDAAKSLDAEKVAEKMREMPVGDAVIRNGTIRSDGRLVHDMYLVEVRRPGESNDPWDLEKVVDTLPGNDVFRPLSESDCPLVKK